VAQWRRDNPLDVEKIIRMMRHNESGANQDGGPMHV
jgi:hypothetical protein